jgi:hypothetical protein
MIHYFYIPFQYETLLAEQIDLFIEQNKRTIVTPIYEEGALIEGYSKVRNIDQQGNITEFPLSFFNVFDKSQVTLKGFIIEGDIESLLPEVYKYMLSLEDVLEFATAEQCLIFLNSK